MIQILNTLLEYLNSKIELTSDNFGNPQIVISDKKDTWYLTHNINEGKYYISKYGLLDVLILDRITKLTKRFGKNPEFSKVINKLKPILNELGYTI